MAASPIATLDYAPPGRRPQMDVPVFVAAAIQILFVVTVLSAGHDFTPAAIALWAVSSMLFLTGACKKPLSRLTYPLGVLCISVETALRVFDDRYQGVDGMTADGIALLFLLHPVIGVLIFRLRRFDRSMLLLALLQLAMIPLVIVRLPAFPGWVRHGPDSARWIYAAAWAGHCGLFFGTLWGLIESFAATHRSRPRLAAVLLLSGALIFFARLFLDRVLRDFGVWITPPWDESYPTPDRDPLALRAYLLAAASPLTLLLVSRSIIAGLNRVRLRDKSFAFS
jgi:hypothetical protein